MNRSVLDSGLKASQPRSSHHTFNDRITTHKSDDDAILEGSKFGAKAAVVQSTILGNRQGGG